MAHHQKHQMDAQRRTSAMQSLLKMFNLSNTPTVPLDEDELSGEADEPPDDQLSPLTSLPLSQRDPFYTKTARPSAGGRRESLLTRAIMAETRPEDSHTASRGLSTTSSHSTASMASTAELTSDGDVTGQSRSATPSPPPPPGRFPHLLGIRKQGPPVSKVLIAPVTKDDKPTVADVGEAAVEKTLGRKRCIMFACGGTESEQSKENLSKDKPQEPEPVKRKCALTFACPTRTSSGNTKVPTPRSPTALKPRRNHSPAPTFKHRPKQDSADLSGRSADTTVAVPSKPTLPSPKTSFHEFGSSHDETDAWMDRPSSHMGKLTLDDCMKKENRIRQLGQEAEEEAEEEEREHEELNLEEEENDNQDDFAPSEDGSDDGNESDDEGGFADSDDESDGGSEYQFWAPSTTTAATSIENPPLVHFSARRRSQASSIESLSQLASPPLHSAMRRPIPRSRHHSSRAIKMRPGTPELPDSTDFVCGTLDEDRPLEAAYISCREQKKRLKHIPIPQDIDPSFPTTDPEDNEEDDDDEAVDNSQQSSDEPRWLKDQFGGFEEEVRGRRGSHGLRVTSPQSSTPSLRTAHPARIPEARRGLHRSPPPRKLFGHSPTRLRSPPPARLRSPRGSPTNMNGNMPFKWGARGLAQRPITERTASLPDTPNPFFRNFRVGSASISNIASGAVTPAAEEPPRSDMHVRGPVDIVIGLEKKRQKRKEKYWRQHCRKAAKEQAIRRPTRGRGAERMKELGLECAERTRGYGLGAQTQLVISL